MSGDQHFTRVDLIEAKTLIAKKLGAQKAERYFNLLNRFFTKKLSKSEFDKLCLVAIGRENITLHNWFIRSIVKNACLSTAPPAKASKLDSVDGKVANGYQRSCLQSLCRDAFPQSPRRGRTPAFRDRKCRDRPSPLGPQGMPHTVTCAELAPKVLEQQSATELHSLGSRPVEVTSVEDGEEVDQVAGSPPSIHSRSPVTAPLGIQIHAKGTRKLFGGLKSSPVPMDTCYIKGELPDTSSLRKRLVQKLEAEGLKVSLDCVNLLNSSLDVYLNRLIKPCLEMASSRVGDKQNEQLRVQNVSGRNVMWPMKHVQRQTSCTSVSLVDLRAAMELNPTLLGKNWPLQLEKVSLDQFR